MTRFRRALRSVAWGGAVAAAVGVAGCGGGSGEGSADGSAGDSGAEVWRFAIEETAGSVQDAYAQEFKRRIEERSGGRVEVKVYPYGALGTSTDLTEQLRMGSLQFAMSSPGHLGTTIPEVQVFLLHFLFSDDNAVNRVALTDPKLLAQLDPLYAGKGLKLLSVFPEGWMVWTANKPIRRPADFEGVKIRTMTSPLLLEAYRAYGASPQAMPYSEVYSGLQLKMIDAQVNPVFAIEEMSFYEVTSHLVFGDHAQYITSAVANAGFFEGLSEERRRMVVGVVDELNPYIFEVQEQYNNERLEQIRERKPDLVTVRLTEAEREAFRQRSLAVRESFVESTGPSGARILDAVLAAVERAEAQVGDAEERPGQPERSGSAARAALSTHSTSIAASSRPNRRPITRMAIWPSMAE